MRYWLLKSEPDVFSIDDLKNKKDEIEHWDGVRNYQARNFIRDDMHIGDQAFFYHSNCKQPGIAGIVKIVSEGYPDFTAWHPESKYYDPKSDEKNPRWYMADIQYIRKLKRLISLEELKSSPQLAEMPLVRRGNRLSVMPVSEAHWRLILDME